MISSIFQNRLTNITPKNVDAMARSIPDFPTEKIKQFYKRDGLDVNDIYSIPKNFSKYFAIIEALSDGNLIGKSLLDVGCGLGAFTSQAKSLGMIPTGIDIFTEYQETCYQRALCIFQAYGHSLSDGTSVFINHDITNNPAPKNDFDFVTSIGMLEHIFGEDVRKNVIHNMMKSLAPDGCLICICGPNKFFPIDMFHYGPKFIFYHCLPLWARRLYLHAFAKQGQNMDPKWLNGMKVTEIKKHILEVDPDAHIIQAFPIWIRLAKSKLLQQTAVSYVVTNVAKLLCWLNIEPVIILIVTKQSSN